LREEDGLWIKLNKMNFKAHILQLNQGGSGWDMLHDWGRGEVFTGFWLGGPKGRPRHRWEDNIKMDLRDIRINGANWIWLAQDRFQWQASLSMVMNLWVP
jgi:hypothetical protein